MVYQVRCFMCGADQGRLIMGGRQILHARCQACQCNLLAEIAMIEREAMEEKAPKTQRKRHTTLNTVNAISRQPSSVSADS